jgi:predicted metal-dependent enzyme (double-stranded beta helix superfamily)
MSALALTDLELLRLARSYAADPASWEPHVNADLERRACHALLRSDIATVWLLCWMPGQQTGFHDHDGAAGAVAVARGAVAEERLRLGAAPVRREFAAGASFAFDGAVIHNVAHAAGAPAVTIHAYSPALRRMGAYRFGAGGELLRTALDEDSQLAPA